MNSNITIIHAMIRRLFGCRGNSYPQIGHSDNEVSTTTAQDGHSSLLITLNPIRIRVFPQSKRAPGCTRLHHELLRQNFKVSECKPVWKVMVSINYNTSD